MEIADIKQNLSLTQVLENYSLQPNKNNMLRCPFHEDNTASLQVSFSQNKYKCHACDKKGDVIQFVQDYEKLTKREAILKCAEMVGSGKMEVGNVKPLKTPNFVLPASDFLEKIFSSFRKGIFNSVPAKDYCKQRNLDLEIVLVR
jgi:DNA primase